MMVQGNDSPGMYGYLVAGLLGALLAIFVGMVTFGRNVVTREEMEDYVAHHSPYAEDKGRVDSILKDLIETQDKHENQIKILEEHQVQVRQKLGLSP